MFVVRRGLSSSSSSVASRHPICIATRSYRYSPYDGLRRRTQAPTSLQQHKDQEPVSFGKTLPSGRIEFPNSGKSTTSSSSSAKQYAPSDAPDRRFSRPLQDYTEVQDQDPYRGLFHESKSTVKLRTSQWQKQFEEENAHVELPYERTNPLSRTAPNWFVRYFVNIRDRGGLDSTKHLNAVVGFTVAVLCAYSVLTQTRARDARPIHEVK